MLGSICLAFVFFAVFVSAGPVVGGLVTIIILLICVLADCRTTGGTNG